MMRQPPDRVPKAASPRSVPSGSRPPLVVRLRSRIAREGPLSFEAFMEAALYDPREGFYARPAVGEGRHFVTSPHVSPAFGWLVARQVAEFWSLLGRPSPFTVVEVGAADGTLAAQLWAALPEELRAHARYVAVERSDRARAEIAGVEGGWVLPRADLDEIAGPVDGCVLANELLDNLPFHVLRGTAGGLRERYVTSGPDGLALVDGPVSSEEVARLTPSLPPGREAVVSPRALEFVERAAGLLRRGYIWIVDYAREPGDTPPAVHGYRGHRLEPDVLADPGSRDITGGVDMEAVARHAASLGLSVWGPASQRAVLLALGYRRWDREARRRQSAALAEGQGLGAVGAWSARHRASLLIEPSGLGGFAVLCLGVGTSRRPRSFRPPASKESTRVAQGHPDP